MIKMHFVATSMLVAVTLLGLTTAQRSFPTGGGGGGRPTFPGRPTGSRPSFPSRPTGPRPTFPGRPTGSRPSPGHYDKYCGTCPPGQRCLVNKTATGCSRTNFTLCFQCQSPPSFQPHTRQRTTPNHFGPRSTTPLPPHRTASPGLKDCQEFIGASSLPTPSDEASCENFCEDNKASGTWTPATASADATCCCGNMVNKVDPVCCAYTQDVPDESCPDTSPLFEKCTGPILQASFLCASDAIKSQECNLFDPSASSDFQDCTILYDCIQSSSAFTRGSVSFDDCCGCFSTWATKFPSQIKQLVDVKCE